MAGKYAAARTSIDDALAIRMKEFGDDSPKAWAQSIEPRHARDPFG
jgi:hypothetical protein